MNYNTKSKKGMGGKLKKSKPKSAQPQSLPIIPPSITTTTTSSPILISKSKPASIKTTTTIDSNLFNTLPDNIESQTTSSSSYFNSNDLKSRDRTPRLVVF